jgi:ubiquinone/menaquinone biosynthesis C-methylase UbiE
MNAYLSLNDKQLKDTINDKHKLGKMISNLCKKNNINPKKATIMDLGCGHGNITFTLSKYFNKVYGIDPSNNMLKYARNLKRRASKWSNFSNIRFYQGEFINIPIKQVDIICLFNSIHFSQSIERDLLNILSNIKVGGLLFIREPHNKSKFGQKLMNNKKDLNLKLKRLAFVRKMLKMFINKYTKKNKISIIFEKELPHKYVLSLKKIEN